MKKLLAQTSLYAHQYLESLAQQAVYPSPENIDALNALQSPLPEEPVDPMEVIAKLHHIGSPATVASAGGRYFGFVIGGVLPAALAANWLAGAWDQNAFNHVSSPSGAILENIALDWLVELLRLPEGCGAGFVTGATMANFSGILAARHALLQKQGWDVETQGLFGAPEIKVVVGEEVHASLLKALSLAGLGRERLIRVPVDDQGRMRPDAMPELTDTTLVCIQAGNVNTGTFDPANAIITKAHQQGAWVHVDGAFGLWALCDPKLDHLTMGFNQADSWATDAHKWLNVPYDSGIIFCQEPLHLKAAMATSASYLMYEESREPSHYTPELSRRARGIEVWAALHSLGRSGMVAMLEKHCEFARQFASGLEAAGYQVLNDVVLNQVLVSFGGAEKTLKVISDLQKSGVCWCGGSEWQGQTAMRISVSSWATTAEDVEQSLEAMLNIAGRET
ncbi:MAG: aspartate aminotransferase family protein [Anaerolineaceae bacterium]|nr:aspartate aminotransferase family protein [Anaerolineaceae bacterium]